MENLRAIVDTDVLINWLCKEVCLIARDSQFRDIACKYVSTYDPEKFASKFDLSLQA